MANLRHLLIQNLFIFLISYGYTYNTRAANLLQRLSAPEPRRRV